MKNRSIFFLIGLLTVLIIFWASKSFVVSVPPKTNLKPSDYNFKISWEEAVEIGRPIAVNFYVDWCPYCLKFAPILGSLSREYKNKITFVSINAEDSRYEELVQDFEISAYPSLFLVNMENDNRVFINQSIYSDKRKLRKEFDRFLRLNH